MQLYLLRHGVAEEGRIGFNDADRALTSDGRRKLRELLGVAAEADVCPTLVLSSPFKRALQTAEIAAESLHVKTDILRTKALIPTASTQQVWDEIRVHKSESELMLVGHDPLFSNLVGYLLGAVNLRIDFKKDPYCASTLSISRRTRKGSCAGI